MLGQIVLLLLDLLQVEQEIFQHLLELIQEQVQLPHLLQLYLLLRMVMLVVLDLQPLLKLQLIQQLK